MSARGDEVQHSSHRLIPILGKGLQKYNQEDCETIDPTNTVDVFDKEIWPYIKKYFHEESNVLDVGCGNGRFSSFIAKHVGRVDAIDGFREISPSHITENIHFYKKNIQEFEGENYDVIFLFGVFYLQESWGSYKAFEMLVSKLHSDGALIIIDDKKRDRDYAKSKQMAAGFYNLKELSDLNGVQILESFIQKNKIHKVSIIR